MDIGIHDLTCLEATVNAGDGNNAYFGQEANILMLIKYDANRLQLVRGKP